MRVLLVFLFFSTFIVAGWWLRQAGPERWPKVTTITNAPNTVTNSVVNPPNSNTSILPTNTAAPSSIILPSPSNLTATATETEVTLTWDPVPFAHGYAITRNDVFLGVVYGTKFLDFALNAGTSYAYSVGSVDTLNVASATLAQVTATTPMTVATAPTTTTTPTNTTTIKPSTKPTTTTKPTSSTPTNTNTTPTTPPTTTTAPTNTAVATPTNTATTTPPPAANTNTVVTPPPPACGQGGSCTTADIASHNTRSNCWVYLTTVNKVYNITGYVSSGSRHPGGDVIVPFCGKNITAPFTSSASGGKKHSSSALNSILQAYYIGPLTP